MGESVLKRVRVTSHDSMVLVDGKPDGMADVQVYVEDPRGFFYVASAVDAEIANLRRCLTATDEQRDEAIAAHNRACKQEQKTFSELCDARAEIARLKAEAAKDAEMIAKMADYIEKTCSCPSKVFGFGLVLVNGRWERER